MTLPRATGRAVVSTLVGVVAVAVAVAWVVVALGRGGETFRPGRSGPAAVHEGQPAGRAAARGDGPTVAWRWRAPGRAAAGMPAADEDHVAVVTGRHRLHLLDHRGRPRWSVRAEGLHTAAPLLAEEAVVAPADDGLLAVDRASGAVRWRTYLGGRAGTPALAAEVVVAPTWAGELVGVDGASGAVRWRRSLTGPVLGPAVAVGGRVVVATWDAGTAAGVSAVDAADGRVVWAASLPAGGVSGPGLVAGRAGVGAPVVAVVAGDAHLHALDATTGALRWRLATIGAGSPEVPPAGAAAGGRVLAVDRLLGVHLAGAASGRRAWSLAAAGVATRGGPVVTARGHWFVPTDDGRLVVGDLQGAARVLDPPGRVVGLAGGGPVRAPVVVAGLREGPADGLLAYRP